MKSQTLIQRCQNINGLMQDCGISRDNGPEIQKTNKATDFFLNLISCQHFQTAQQLLINLPACVLLLYAQQTIHHYFNSIQYVDGLVQDCCTSSALARQLLQSCTKPSMYCCFSYDIHIHQKVTQNILAKINSTSNNFIGTLSTLPINPLVDSFLELQ